MDEFRRIFHSAFFKVNRGTARRAVCRDVIPFASCLLAAAFGGVALAAWETTLLLIAAKWLGQVQTPATDEWESYAAVVDTRGPGCERKRDDEHSEHTASLNWGPAFALLRPNEVMRAELIQIHDVQIK